MHRSFVAGRKFCDLVPRQSFLELVPLESEVLPSIGWTTLCKGAGGSQEVDHARHAWRVRVTVRLQSSCRSHTHACLSLTHETTHSRCISHFPCLEEALCQPLATASLEDNLLGSGKLRTAGCAIGATWATRRQSSLCRRQGCGFTCIVFGEERLRRPTPTPLDRTPKFNQHEADQTTNKHKQTH